MARLKPFLRGWSGALRGLFCAAVFAAFTWNAAFFYLPGQGFTYLIQFGDKLHSRFLPQVNAVSHYEKPQSEGYDSQYYAQIAVDPKPSDPALRKSVDGLAYRIRRILFPVVAWVAGAGDPQRVLNAFALENVVCWYLLAFLLFRWLPPDSWGHCLRWAAVLLSFGMTFSVARALLDGPSLLLISLGVMLLETGRPWLGSLVLGVSGLGKETNLLGAAALEPPEDPRPRSWAAVALQFAVVVLPLAAWTLCLRFWIGQERDLGNARNFGFPFEALAEKMQQSVSQFIAEDWLSVAKYDILVVVGLLAQLFFFASRIRWRERWWRIGAAYAVLMIFLGGAVWEFYPSAAARVLLPMTLAFNILVPRGRGWAVLLVVGNLGILGSPDIFEPPGRESFSVTGPNALKVNPADGRKVEALYDETRWWHPERTRWEFWRWSKGNATITLRNPQPFTLLVRLHFRVRSADVRRATIVLKGHILWERLLPPKRSIDTDLPEIELPPGDTVLEFRGDKPATFPGNNDPRRLNISVRDLEIQVEARR